MKFSEFTNIIDDKDALIIINGNLYEILENSLLICGINNFLYIDNLDKDSLCDSDYWYQIYKTAKEYKLHIIDQNVYQFLSVNFKNYDVFSYISYERKVKNFFNKSYKLKYHMYGSLSIFENLEVKKSFKAFE
jgi:hypothetical protein